VENRENFRLIAGAHRLEAARRLGLPTISCTILESDDDLRVELAEIDENSIRNDPSSAEHALLTGRRAEIIKQLAAERTLSQPATASRQSQRRAGQETGSDPGSVRDHANKTGESKDRIQRSKKRFETLGSANLKKVVGTSLDKAGELDALAQLSEAAREDLANRAASGEVVSARTIDRKPKPKPDRKVELTRREKAYAEFVAWEETYVDLEEFAGLGQQLLDIHEALMKPEDRLWPPQQQEAEGDDA
jgi:ParB family chromosome partitioning protein